MNGDLIVQGMIYMYFIAFAVGMGLLTAGAIGYKVYKRALNKNGNSKRRVKRGATA